MTDSGRVKPRLLQSLFLLTIASFLAVTLPDCSGGGGGGPEPGPEPEPEPEPNPAISALEDTSWNLSINGRAITASFGQGGIYRETQDNGEVKEGSYEIDGSELIIEGEVLMAGLYAFEVKGEELFLISEEGGAAVMGQKKPGTEPDQPQPDDPKPDQPKPEDPAKPKPDDPVKPQPVGPGPQPAPAKVGRIVMVGYASNFSSTIRTSDDNGKTWTSVTEQTYRVTLNCVVYDPVANQFYAGGEDGDILVSSGGTSWSTSTGTGDEDDTFYGCASDGKGKLIIVGDSRDVWKKAWSGVIRYRNLAGPTYYSYLVHSDSPLAGIEQNQGFLTGAAADGSGRFVAVGYRKLQNPIETISVARYSTDGGKTWVEHTAKNATVGIVEDVQLNDVTATQANTFYAVGDDGTVVVTSDGGATWTEADIPAAGTASLNGIASDKNTGATTMVIVGSGGLLLLGEKGAADWTWSKINSGTSSHLMDVTTNGSGYWIAVGTGGSVVYSTDNAKTWTAGKSGTTEEFYGVAIGK